jgi:hypothetical protein
MKATNQSQSRYQIKVINKWKSLLKQPATKLDSKFKKKAFVRKYK